MKKKVLVLGCTGSIGQSALSIIDSLPDSFILAGISAHSNKDKLEAIAKKFSCKNYCLSSDSQKNFLDFIKNTDADIVVNGIAGSAGLMPSVAALESNKNLALANKETMVMAGRLIKSLAAKHQKKILPVDSEHSAVFMLIEKYGHENVDKIILTASGGPFRKYTKEQLENVTLEDALKHPTWNMGQKITIDSATLANKGLEVIEAVQLFDIPQQRVQVVVHPQSIVHSLIRTTDGVMYAQLSKPDMRHPIVTALTYPEFIQNKLEQLDFLYAGENGTSLEFYPPRKDIFPMLNLAYKACDTCGSGTIAFNAANEVAVSNFVSKAISFTQIPNVTEYVLSKITPTEPQSFDQVFQIDEQSRKFAEEFIKKYGNSK